MINSDINLISYIKTYPKCTVVVPTTIMIDRHNRAIMRSNLEKELIKLDPDLTKNYGQFIKKSNIPYNIYCTKLNYSELIIVCFPISYDNRDSSQLSLIESSCNKLIKLINKLSSDTEMIYIPKSGYTGLDFKSQVLPIFDRYFKDYNNIIIC